MASDATDQANRAEIDPKRFVIISYILLGLVVAFFLANILEKLFVQVGWSMKPVISGIGVSSPDHLVGFVLALGIGIYCWVNPQVHGLSVEVATELKRVSWPSWEETRVSTFAVVVASLVAAVILAAIDSLSVRLMVDWLPIVWQKLVGS